LAENVETEEVTPGEEIPVELPTEEAPERVIEIRAPKPFDEEALEPFIDIYMTKRGLTDKKQAAVSLARVLWKMGYNPQREIENVTTYINNLATVMDAIPDTAETLPVKGALLSRGAMESDQLLRRGHFGGREMGLEDEFKDLTRFAMKARVTMRSLDNIFAGDEMGTESKTVQSLAARVERMEKEKEFEAALAPIKLELKNLSDTIKELGKGPKTAEESEALTGLRGEIQKISDRFEKKEERDSLAEAMKGIRDDLKGLGDDLKTGGGKGVTNVGDAFDQAVALIDKITELTKKGGGGGEGEIDWKATAITTAGEIATETIKAARDIMSGKEAEEEEKRPTETKKELVSERIVDRKLLNYIRERVTTGATQINSKSAAKDLNLTEQQVMESHARLKEKGLIVTPGEPRKKGPLGGKGESAEEWVDG